MKVWDYKSTWDRIYKEKGAVQKEPSPRVIPAIDFCKKKGYLRVLDLGCGTGRHAKELIGKGFDVYGCDVSEEAINILKKEIDKASFEVCEMTSLPYDDGFFDAIICNQTLQHGVLAEIKKAVAQMRRVLRKDGFLFVAVSSMDHSKNKMGVEIEENTRIDTASLDKELPHHFFSANEMEGLFSDFSIIKLEHYKAPSELDPDMHAGVFELHALKK